MNELSIIIPTYNQSDKLLRNLKLLRKASDYISIIVVDDGSSCAKENKDICYRFNSEYYYIKNSGPSYARCFGLNKVNTNYVLFLDTDDLFDVSKILNVSSLIGHSDYITFKSNYKKKLNGVFACECINNMRVVEIKKSILNVSLGILGVSNSILWNQSNTIYKKASLLGIYEVRNLSWGEDIPLKIIVSNNLNGVFIHCNDISIIEISYGRGCYYSYQQVLDLTINILKLKNVSYRKYWYACVVYFRFLFSMLYKNSLGRNK